METVEWFEEVEMIADNRSNPEEILMKFEELEEEFVNFEEFINGDW